MSETFPLLTGDALSQRFLALDAFLLEHQRLWRPRPFSEPTMAWEAEHAELASWLRGRSLEQADAEHNQPTRLAAPAPYPQLAAQAAALGAVGELPLAERPQAPNRFNVDVPGRKWQQIGLFAGRLQFARPVVHWLDWCSGKGHLGRLLAHAGQPLTCLEHDPALVADGQRLSDRLGSPPTTSARMCWPRTAPSACFPGIRQWPCTLAANYTCACCAWPARPAVANWRWRHAATTAFRGLSTSHSRKQQADRCSRYRLTTCACP